MKRTVPIILALLLTRFHAWAQCAMCKTTIVNNVSNGELSLAGGLNFGIIYLFITPYLAVLVVGFLWYKKSKNHAKKKFRRSNISL